MTSPYAEVVGDPIAQSRSPQIHTFWLKALGIEGAYRAHRVTRAELPDYLAKRRADPAWRGCNVTMPLKLDALMLADDPTDRATAAGAANLLVHRDGKLIAANSDVGAVRDLVAPLVTAGEATLITLLGNGGAARAVLLALRLLGAGPVALQARRREVLFELRQDHPGGRGLREVQHRERARREVLLELRNRHGKSRVPEVPGAGRRRREILRRLR